MGPVFGSKGCFSSGAGAAAAGCGGGGGGGRRRGRTLLTAGENQAQLLELLEAFGELFAVATQIRGEVHERPAAADAEEDLELVAAEADLLLRGALDDAEKRVLAIPADPLLRFFVERLESQVETRHVGRDGEGIEQREGPGGPLERVENGVDGIRDLVGLGPDELVGLEQNPGATSRVLAIESSVLTAAAEKRQ